MEKNTLFRKGIAVVVILLFIGMSVIPSTGSLVEKKSTMPTFYDGNTLYVGGSGPNNYTKIQDAINDSSNGDAVYVYDDSSPYSEHLNIMKSITVTGENNDTTKIYGIGKDKDILFIESTDVVVSDFTIQYGSNHNSGILIKDSSHVTIKDCKFSNIPSMDAITVSASENTNIVNCMMSGTFGDSTTGYKQIDRYISGITLEGGCYNTTISGNTISNASYAGIILLEGCNNTKIIGNYIHSNDKYGIRAQHCNYTYIEENIISKNKLKGIVIYTCKNTLIYRNSCENNNNAGVGIGDSAVIHVESNNFIRNGLMGYFSYNFGEGFTNILPDIIWKENYWDRARIFPKPIFGFIVYQKDSQSPIIVFPWLNFDWHPAQEPYDIS